MAGLLDLLKKQRAARHMADGGLLPPTGALLRQQKQAIAGDVLQRAAQVQQGALSTDPGPGVQLAGDATPTNPEPTQEALDVRTQGFPRRMVQAGMLDVESGLRGAMAATAQALGEDNFAHRQRNEAMAASQRAENITPDQVKDIREVGADPSKAGSYIFGQALRGVPQIGGALVAGGVGGMIGGLPGAAAGAGAFSAAQNAGQIYTEANQKIDQMQVPEEEKARLRQGSLAPTAIGGIVSAVLDTGALGYVMKANPALKSAFAKSLIGHIGRSALVEGGTEAVQQYVQQVAEKHILENPDKYGITKEDAWEIANAGAAGASMALPFAPAGHFGHGIAAGVDATIDAAGKAVRGVRGAAQKLPGFRPAPEGETQPSAGARAGTLAAALMDGNLDQLREAGASLVDSVKAIPGVGAAMQQGQDFISEAGKSVRVGRLKAALGKASEVMSKGFDDFRAAVGETAETGNIENARDRYTTLFAQFLHSKGIKSDEVGRASGEALGALISGFNAKLPEIESSTGAIFNTAVGVAKHGYDQMKSAAREAVAGWDTVKPTVDGLAEGLKTEGPRQTKIGGTLDDAEKRLRDDLIWMIGIDKADRAQMADMTLLARRMRSKFKNDPVALDAWVERNKDDLTQITDLDAGHIKQVLRHAYVPGGGERQSGMERAAQFAVDENGQEREPPISDSQGEAIQEHDPNTDDVGITEKSSPNETASWDNQYMEPQTFAKMLARPDQIDKQKNMQMGNRDVRVSRQEYDPNGKPVGEPAESVHTVNLRNIAESWKDRHPAVDKRSEQHGNDRNFMEGVTGLLHGWPEDVTDPKKPPGHKIIASVEPGYTEDHTGRFVPLERVTRPDIERDEKGRPITKRPITAGEKGWLFRGAPVGKGKKAPRTLGELEKGNRANQPYSVDNAVEQYHMKYADLIARQDERMRTKGRTPASRALLEDFHKRQTEEFNARHGEKIARAAADSLWDKLEQGTDPEEAQRGVDAAIDYVLDPKKHSKEDVPKEIADLSPEVLDIARTPLLGRLSDLESGRLQDLQLSEHERSVDNPDYRDLQALTPEKPTQDLAGEGINATKYAKDEAAGRHTPEPAPPKKGVEPPKAEKTGTESNPAALSAQRRALRTGEQGVLPTVEPRTNYRDQVPDKDVGPTTAAQKNLLDLRRRAATAPGRALLERAMAAVSGDRRLDDATLNKLADPKLKPQDVERVLAGAKFEEPSAAPLANLRKRFAGAKTEEGKALLKEVARLVKEGKVSQEDLSSLTNTTRALNKQLVESIIARSGGEAAPEVATQRPKAETKLKEGSTLVDTTDPKEQERIIDAIKGVIGDHAKIAFDPKLDHQGHWDAAKKLINLAAQRGFVYSNAFHEAFHVIDDHLLSPEQRETIYKALRNGPARHQLAELLKDHPEAWEHAKGDSKEMAAYAFQFYHAGQLTIGPKGDTIISKVIKAWTNLSAWLRGQSTADQLFKAMTEGAFKDGKVDIAAQALAKSHKTLQNVQHATKAIMKGVDKIYSKMLGAYDDRMRDMGNPFVDKVAKLFYVQVGETNKQRGMVQEMPIQINKWMNALDKVMRHPSGEFEKTLQEMSLGDKPTNTEVGEGIRKWLDGMHDYMKKAGIDIDYVKDYIPMSWAGEKIAANRDGFVRMLAGHQDEIDALNKELLAKSGKSQNFKEMTPDSIADTLIARTTHTGELLGSVYDDHGAPNADFTYNRVLTFLDNAERRPWMRDDLSEGMMRYGKQAVRRAEWSRRFGETGSGFEALIEQAKKYGMTKEQEDLIREYKDSAFGAQLHKMNPTLRNIYAINTVYQNWRVLGLSLLSNVIDPMGVAVRSGEASEAFNAYKMAVGRIFKKGKMKTADLEELAQTIGAIERVGVADSLHELYGGVNIEGKLRKANDALFNYNGMNGLTRSVRLSALAAGIRFLTKHGQKGGDARQLHELGLTKEDLHFDDRNNLKILERDGLDAGQSEKVQRALNRFVDESAMRPNVGERTSWGANPYLAPLFHLKQYLFSFNKVINKKMEHELLEHGNITPYLMATAYIPIMAISSMTRDLALHGGTLPEQNGMLHYLWSGAMRSGLMGPSDIAELMVGGTLTGNMNDVRQALGPTADQMMDVVGAVASSSHVHSLGGFVKESLPLGSVAQHY